MAKTRPKKSAFEDDPLLHYPDGGRGYEWVAGRITYVAEPDPLHGYFGFRLGARLVDYVERNDLGLVTGLDAFFLLKREPRVVRGADVAFVAKERLTEPLQYGVWVLAPDLVVEVRSRSDRSGKIKAKIADYMEAGVRLLWVVDPKTKTVAQYRPGQAEQTFGAEDVLDGEDVLPGFRCAVGTLFR